MAFVDLGWLAAVLLLAVRLGAIALVAPPLGARTVPAAVRVSLVVALAALLASLPASQGAAAAMTNMGALLAAMASEFALGATMALGLNMGFAVFTFAARLVDVQIGYGIGQVIDPATSQHLPIVTALFAQLAVLVFFLLDGHHAMLRALVLSIERFPPGRGWTIDAALVPVVRQVGLLSSLGLAMLAPVVLTLLLVELGFGVLARSLPQINVLALGFGIKVVAGSAALSIALTTSSSVMTRAYRSVFHAWESMLR
jgi:flagellar biosynthetic protein FliR